MSQTVIRSLQGDEMLEAMYALNSYAFHGSPPLTDKQEWFDIVSHRQGVTFMVLFEDARPVAGAASTAMQQQVRGRIYPANGIWGVATDPTARRKGYCRQVMMQLLASLHLEGQAFSTLYPFRESFYQRLGYLTFPLTKIATLATQGLQPLLHWDLTGHVERMLIGEGFDFYIDFLKEMQLTTHGLARFSAPDRHAAERNRSWLALAQAGGETIGVMLYDL